MYVCMDVDVDVSQTMRSMEEKVKRRWLLMMSE